MKRLMLSLAVVTTTACSVGGKETRENSVHHKYYLLEKAANVVPNGRKIEKSDQESLVDFCYADDVRFEKAHLILKKMALNFKESNKDQFVKLFSQSFKGSSFLDQRLKSKQDIGNSIVMTSMSPSGKEVDLNTFQESLNKYLKQFKKIQSVHFEPLDYKVGIRDRNQELIPKVFTSDVLFTLKGVDESGALREDRATLKISLVEVEGAWLVSNLSFKDSLRLTKADSGFVELDLKKAGLADLKSYERLEAIRRGGYTLALSDYDNDGVTDFLLGSYGKLQIYKGSKSGQFIPVKNSGIEEHTLVKSAIFADFNNDGHKDLLIVRFVEADDKTFQEHFNKNSDLDKSRYDNSKKVHVNSVVIYQNLGNGKFKKSSELIDSIPAEHAMPAAVADFDNDGLLDIYIGYPGVKDFTTFSKDAPSKLGKKAQGIYLNKGNFSFIEKNMNAKEKFEIFSEENIIYPHSAVAADYNQDGLMDIVVVDDRGNLSVAYKNLGKAEFVIDNDSIGFQNYGIGMGLAVADYNNDGRLDMALTNVAFNHRNRMGKSCKANWDVYVEHIVDLAPREPFRLFRNDYKQNKLIDVASASGVVDVGDGLGGVEFLDYDNDGLQDFYIANGLWTGTSKTNDLAGLFDRALKHYVEEGIYEGPVNTRSFMMDILANYRDAKGQTPSMAGYQENKLFRNLGNGKFIEVGYLEGVDSIADGYVVGTADINGDGVVDIVLRNADPGVMDVKYPPLQIYLGKKSSRQSVQLTLQGTISNRDAIGTQVMAKVKGMPIQVRQLLANNGTIQSEQKLWFSLGREQVLDELTIRWPSGKLQVLKNLKPGNHHVVEPDQERVITKN